MKTGLKTASWEKSLLKWYRKTRLKLLCWLALRGRPRRVTCALDGKPKENYDCYFLLLKPKKNSGKNVLWYRPLVEDGKGEWVSRSENRDTKIVISAYDLAHYRSQLVHYNFDHRSEYRSLYLPLLIRVSGLAAILNFFLYRVLRYLKTWFDFIFTATNDKFRLPQKDRYFYLRACIQLGYTGQKFRRKEVLESIYGTSNFGPDEWESRSKIAGLVLESLKADGAVTFDDHFVKIEGRALSLYQQMCELRDKRKDDLSHNAHVRVLTTILALGVLFQIGKDALNNKDQVESAYDKLIGLEMLSFGQFAGIALLVVVACIFWLKQKINSKQSPNIDF